MSDFSDLFDNSNLGKTIWSQFADKQIKSAEKQKKSLISLQIQQHEKTKIPWNLTYWLLKTKWFIG